MAITPLPTPPSRAQSPANFSSTADTFVAALPTFVTEANALTAGVNTIKNDTQAIKDAAVSETTAIKNAAISETTAIKNGTESYRTQAAGSASAATGSADFAAARAQEAAASSNFKGDWAALSGSVSLPASTRHNGVVWMLSAPVANVAIHEPGISSVWFVPSSPAVSINLYNAGVI